MAINFHAPNPARLDRLPHIPMKRLGPAGKISGVITCHQTVDTPTHFIGNRTLPCAGDDCAGCAAHRRKGWERYVSLWTASPSQHIITAMPPDAALEMDNAIPNLKNLRGWWLILTRQGKRPNGRIVAEVKETPVQEGVLPAAPELLKHMYKIWGLDPNEIDEQHPLWSNRFALFDAEIETNGDGLRKAK